ncbi:MAG: cobalt ECF transporter T component CbiQ [Deltaproteobacteria bacterium]|nr:MAG: cobalt ECF transporter T component CbiQ [Deltaproteobacteria bacterium]
MKHDFLDKYSSLNSPIHRLDARAKIIAFIGMIIFCVSSPPNAYLAFLGYALFLLIAAALSRVPPTHILKSSLVVIPFVILVAVFIPFLKPDHIGGGYSLGIGKLTVSRSGLVVFENILIKSYLAIISVILLSSTTPFPKLLRGFEQLKVPKLVIMLASFAYRYLFLLIEEIERMERARDARAYRGRWLWQAKVIGQMIGSLFLRSYERGERVYVAMASRGFTGEIVGFGKTKFQAKDVLFLFFALLFFTFLRIEV